MRYVHLIFLDTIKKELQYRGRLFELKNLEIINDKNELLEAMQLIAKTGNGPKSNFQALDVQLNGNYNYLLFKIKDNHIL